MRCVTCGVDLIAGKQFCHACGAPVGEHCRGCGTHLAATFRFCPDCGLRVDADPVETPPPVPTEPPRAPLAPSPIPQAPVGEGERKLVTVLFCDLVGSTAIAERLDPEEYGELLKRYHDLAFPEVYRREGLVNQLAGDGFMALFGAPIAHEDAPQRAVRSALAIRDAVQPLARELEARHAISLQLRIGIHTGAVVVGTVGDDRKMDYTATGDTTNLAARLQALAPANGILISEATHRLVRGFADVEPAGSLEVRGRTEPVVAYAVREWRGAATRLTIDEARGLTPFVGRADELSQLASAYRRLADGGGLQLVAVAGDAGSGKSRLLYEWKRTLGDEQAVFFEGRCASMLQALPYHPFMSMFARYFDLDWDDSVEASCEKLVDKFGAPYAEIERRYPLLCRFLALPIEHLADQPADELKRETFDALAGLVLGEAKTRPVVMVLEDLHWIDEPSLELLDDLGRSLARAPVLLVVTHRPDAVPPCRVRTRIEKVELSRLEDHETGAIVDGVAGGPIPRELRALLVTKSGGSPFFAEELMRGLLEEGHLVAAPDGGLRLARPLHDVPIPGTVQEVIAARLDRLDAASKRCVQVAAVLGRQFRQSQLEMLLADESLDVGRALVDLERRGLLHRKDLLASDELRFGESLTQEVAYESLLHRQRRQLHERVGQLLEGADDDDRGAGHTALLAHHFERSDNHVKAVEALLLAARDAEQLPSYGVAADLYRRAWQLAEASLGEREDGYFHRAALQATNGVSRLAIFFGAQDLGEIERAALRGRELAELLGDTEALSGLTYAQGVLMTMRRVNPDFPAGLALVERGVAMAQEAGLQGQVIRLARGLCTNYVADGRFEEASRYIEPILAELERAGERERFAPLYLTWRWVRDLLSYASDDLDAVLKHGRETFELARRGNNRTMQSALPTIMGPVHFLRAEYEAAREWSEIGLAVAEDIANVNAIATPASIAMASRLELGEAFDPAPYVERIERGLAAAGTMQLNLRFVAEGLIAVGDLERADRITETLVRNTGGRLRQGLVVLARGDVLRHLGRFDEATRCYGEACALAETIGSRSILAGALLGAAEGAAVQGERPAALERLVALCDELHLERYRPRIAALVGADDRAAAVSSRT